jgi:uncharacterized protein YcfL
MITRQPISLLGVLGALALLAGCSTVPAPQAPMETTKFTVENTDRFVALDSAAEAAVSCTGLQERTLGDGRIEVVANLKNSGATPARIRVQCVFVDEQGSPLGGEVPWQPLEIAAQSTEVVRFTAPGLAARRYVIRVRTAR